MSVELTVFDPSDLEALDCRPVHQNIKDAAMPMLREVARWRVGLARTVVAESGQVLACAGIVPGTGEAWAFVDKDARRYALALVRAARQTLTEWGKPVYATVDNADPQAVRLAEAIGFRFHGGRKWVYDPSAS